MLNTKNAPAASWQGFAKAEELRKRIFFTLWCLVVYRIGSYIPLSGVNPQVMMDFASQNSGGFLGMLDMFSGGALGRATIMTLNIVPYITASIMVQLLSFAFPYFESLRKEGELGRRKLNQYTRYLAVALASVEAYAIAVGLERITSGSDALVLDPGFFFRTVTTVTLVGSTLFLVWLGEQISSRGIGNGTSMIIYTGIVANLPQAAFRTLELGKSGAISWLLMLGIILAIGAVIAFVVFMEKAYRSVVVIYPKRQVGVKITQEGRTYLPIKLNTAGVLPPIFASSVLMMPSALAGLAGSGGWLASALSHLQHGQPLFILLYVSLIVFFAFFYTSIVFNPKETADNLKKNNGFVQGYKPGQNTASYFDYLLTRLTVIGAAYLSLLCVLPEVVMSQITLSFFFSGTSILILVSVTIDTVSQVQTHLFSQQYAGLLKRQRMRGYD